MQGQSKSRLTKKAIQEKRARADAASPLPWAACAARNSQCTCGMIWSKPSDAVVAIAQSVDNDPDGEGFTREQFLKNLDFLSESKQDVLDLCAHAEVLANVEWEARRLRRALAEATENVVVFLGELDQIMRGPASAERGKQIGHLCNALDMANDMIRYGMLRVDFRTDDKERIRAQVRRRVDKQGG